jgi:hypothetical protein
MTQGKLVARDMVSDSGTLRFTQIDALAFLELDFIRRSSHQLLGSQLWIGRAMGVPPRMMGICHTPYSFGMRKRIILYLA